MIEIIAASEQQTKVINAFFARHSVAFADYDVKVHVGRSNSMQREAFDIEASKSSNFIEVKISVTDLKSVRWALNALRVWLKNGASEPLTLSDRPDFASRGVIEGFYGNPWTHQQRLIGIEHFGDFGMNMFLIAPKDSQWQRFQWRTPLTNEFVEEIGELVERGIQHGVDVSACVSPGLSVSYSSDDDVQAVVNRFLQMAAVGATHFGLLLDDIPDTLQGADVEAYGNIAQAHADFANRVRLGLIAADPSAHVILCPMHYAGRGNEPYLQVMGDQLHPQIELMWTGREICSGYLDISDAVIFDRTSRRPPFYWDNYPVNDGSMAQRLHIGPIAGREAGLQKYSAGLLANPMEHFYASLLPLGTIGAYLWKTETYDPYVAWDEILSDLVPVECDRKAIREFFRNSLGLTGAWAPAFNKIIGECSTAWRGGDPQKAAAAARAGAAEIAHNSAVLNSPEFCAPDFLNDVKPWLVKYEMGGQWLNRVAAVLDSAVAHDDKSLHAPLASREELITIRGELNNNPRRLFGDGFDIMLGELAFEISFN